VAAHTKLALKAGHRRLGSGPGSINLARDGGENIFVRRTGIYAGGSSLWRTAPRWFNEAIRGTEGMEVKSVSRA
jgi:hypothetical protein